LAFPVSLKFDHQLSQDLPDSNISTTSTVKEVFKYLSHTISDLFRFEKRSL